MWKRFLMTALVGGVVTAFGWSGDAQASPLDQTGAIRAEVLDGVSVDYARHTREHRMWEIQRRMRMQQRGRGYGPPPGRGYRREGFRGRPAYRGPGNGPPGYVRGGPAYRGPGNGPPGYSLRERSYRY